MRMFLISDNIDTLTGMRLAGVEGVVAHTREEAEVALQAAASDRTVGIILVTEKLADTAPDAVKELKLHSRDKLLVEIPDRHGTTRGKDSITAYVNEAIGLKI